MVTKTTTGPIVVELERCVACKGCELACARVHAGFEDAIEAALAGAHSVPRVHVLDTPAGAVPVQCQHCEEPVCVLVCPADALVRDEETGRVRTIEEECIGCGACVRACPYGAIFYDARAETVVKCDLCEGIVEPGEDPACVVACPTSCRHVAEEAQDIVEAFRQAARRARTEVSYSIDSDACICCGRCARECPVECITGKAGKAPEKATEEDRRKDRVGEPFVVDQETCVRCGRCYEACPVNAVQRT
jgi:carbon-monoxide dehydrogenase iron sulfur subunit